jgi:hypothetical protein
MRSGILQSRSAALTVVKPSAPAPAAEIISGRGADRYSVRLSEARDLLLRSVLLADEQDPENSLLAFVGARVNELALELDTLIGKQMLYEAWIK